MRTQLITTYIFLFLSITQNIICQEYVLDTKKSSIIWTGKAAFSSYTLEGTIRTQKGTVIITNNSISKLNIIINMKSIDHQNNDLKKHLKNEDFFEVNTYPKSIFSIIKEILINNKKAILEGELTIKEKTNTENIPVNIEQTESTIILRFKYALNRTKYGVNHNSPSIFNQIKENAIADDFLLEGILVFTQ